MATFEVKEGNQCIFMLFTGFNFLVFLSSLGILSCSVYIWAIIPGNSIYVMAFLIFGGSLMIMTTCAFKLRKSIHLLGCYLILLLAVFSFLLIFSLVLLLNTSKAIEWGTQKYNEEKRGNPSMGDSLDQYI